MDFLCSIPAKVPLSEACIKAHYVLGYRLLHSKCCEFFFCQSAKMEVCCTPRILFGIMCQFNFTVSPLVIICPNPD